MVQTPQNRLLKYIVGFILEQGRIRDRGIDAQAGSALARRGARDDRRLA